MKNRITLIFSGVTLKVYYLHKSNGSLSGNHVMKNGLISLFLSQGQVEAHVRLQASAPEDAEFYVVIQGSTHAHVTTAKRGDDGLTLCFVVPGM